MRVLFSAVQQKVQHKKARMGHMLLRMKVTSQATERTGDSEGKLLDHILCLWLGFSLLKY